MSVIDQINIKVAVKYRLSLLKCKFITTGNIKSPYIQRKYPIRSHNIRLIYDYLIRFKN